MSPKSKNLFLLIAVFLTLITACSDDPADPAATTGTIIINGSPDEAEFPYSLETPAGLIISGTSDATLTEMPPGTYTINWNPTIGWLNNPAGSSINLEAGNTVTFTGTYDNEFSPSTDGDMLIGSYKTANTQMIPGAMPQLLHPDFKMIISNEVFDQWFESDNPLINHYFGAAEMAGIHDNMVGGIEGLDEFGMVVPAFESISFPVLDRISAWVEVPAEDVTFGGRGAYSARFATILFFYPSLVSRFEVSQDLEFVTVKGDDDFWYLLGIRAASTVDKATEVITYDRLLTYYRNID